MCILSIKVTTYSTYFWSSRGPSTNYITAAPAVFVPKEKENRQGNNKFIQLKLEKSSPSTKNANFYLVEYAITQRPKLYSTSK